MDKIDQTAEEVMDSLTGHEEMAISQHFGKVVADLADNDPSMMLRALVFVCQRRQDGVNDDDARNAALDLRAKDVLDFFPDPVSKEAIESGKGAEEQPQQPAASLISVS